MKRFIWPSVLLIVVAFIAWPKVKEAQQAQATASAAPKASPDVIVKAEIVTTSPFQVKTQSVGTLLPSEQCEIHSEISGKVASIHFKEGEQVSKGDLLLTIAVPEMKAMLAKAEAGNRLAIQNEKRLKQLLQKEAISQQEYDVIQTNVVTTEAEVNNLKAQIQKTEILAPFNGKIGLRAISEGAYITPATQIANLVADHVLKLEFSINGKYVENVKIGQEVTFETEAKKAQFKAKIYAIESSIDPLTRTLKIRALVENANHSLMAGAYVSTFYTFANFNETIMIPSEAIVPEANGQKVWRVVNGKPVSSPVITGSRTDKSVQVLEGIAKGDTIITSGVQNVKPKSTLSITVL